MATKKSTGLINSDLAFSLEKIQGYDKPTIKKDEYENDGTDIFTIEVNDNSFMYASHADRNKDFKKLKSILAGTATKILFIEVEIQNGEYEYFSQSLHTVPLNTNENEFGENHAKTFYSNFSHEEGGSYYFSGGEVATTLYKAKEITEEEFKVLSKFI